MKGAFLLLKEGFLQSKGKKDWKDIEWKKCYWMTACCMGKNEQLEWCVHALLWACVVPSCCCCCRCSVCACCTLNDTQNFYAFIRPFLEVQNETKRHTDTCGTGLHDKERKSIEKVALQRWSCSVVGSNPGAVNWMDIWFIFSHWFVLKIALFVCKNRT